MGYVGKLELKLKAQQLRKKGFSYNEINKHVDVSKSTLSQWCKDIKLTPKQLRSLSERKQTGQRKGSVIAARNKQVKRTALREKLRQDGAKEVDILGDRDNFIAGIALYSAEGLHNNDRRTSFSNSDPTIIKFIMRWFRCYCQVIEERFRGAIWIHENLDKEEALRFWSDLTGIPQDRFHKTYVVQDKKNSKKVRKNKHPYGVFKVTFNDTMVKRKLDGWVAGLLNQ